MDTLLHAMEGRRLVSTETQVVDEQSKLGGDTEAGKGDMQVNRKLRCLKYTRVTVLR